jgi:hypothetical protein
VTRDDRETVGSKEVLMTLVEAEKKFEKLLTPLPEEFTKAGLEFVGKRMGSTLMSDFVLFVFTNSQAQTSLEIAVNTRGILDVEVAKEGERSFTLDNYLKHHKRNDEYKMEFHLSYDPPKFLEYLRKIVATEWLDILQGKRWENIPFDRLDY